MLGDGIEEGLFNKCMELLKRGSVAGKLDALLFVQDIITSDIQENRDFLVKKATALTDALQAVLNNLVLRSKSQIPLKFLHYFLDVVHKLTIIKPFLKVDE